MADESQSRCINEVLTFKQQVPAPPSRSRARGLSGPRHVFGRGGCDRRQKGPVPDGAAGLRFVSIAFRMKRDGGEMTSSGGRRAQERVVGIPTGVFLLAAPVPAASASRG